MPELVGGVTSDTPRQRGGRSRREVDDVTITAIPTKYRDLQFRSRLEATWAAMFDQLDWPWEYEPFDLEGWIPDFALKFTKPLLIEVKPFLTLDDAKLCVEEPMMVCKEEVLLLGAAPILVDNGGQPTIGILIEKGDCGQDCDQAHRWWAQEGVLFTCQICKHVSVYHAISSYHCRRCGGADGDHHLGNITVDVYRLWARAKNAVQWKSPR